MTKPLLIVGGISLMGMALLAIPGANSANDYFSNMGLVAFLGAALDVVLGLALLLLSIWMQRLRPYAAAALILGPLLLLCSFTLCSTTTPHFGHL